MALKGMQGSPLEHLLVQRHLSQGGGLPSMGGGHMSSMKPHMPKVGGMEMQPKVKPMESNGFRKSPMSL